MAEPDCEWKQRPHRLATTWVSRANPCLSCKLLSKKLPGQGKQDMTNKPWQSGGNSRSLFMKRCCVTDGIGRCPICVERRRLSNGRRITMGLVFNLCRTNVQHALPRPALRLTLLPSGEGGTNRLATRDLKSWNCTNTGPTGTAQRGGPHHATDRHPRPRKFAISAVAFQGQASEQARQSIHPCMLRIKSQLQMNKNDPKKAPRVYPEARAKVASPHRRRRRRRGAC